MAPQPGKLDNRIQIVTPENIAFEYQVAGPFARLPAYLLDVLLRFAGVMILGFAILLAFGSVGLAGVGVGVWMLVWFLLEWFYGGVFETFWNGQTPGKRALGLRVVSTDGQPINALQAVLRNVLRAVDTMPVAIAQAPIPLGQVGLIATMSNRRYQRLGDLACGTMVIVEDRRRMLGVARIHEPQAVALAALIPADFTADSRSARALSMYVERRRNFAPARRSEIASHLGRVFVERFNLPPDTSHDLLLCALYHRTFITDRIADEPELAPDSPFLIAPVAASPFAAAPPQTSPPSGP